MRRKQLKSLFNEICSRIYPFRGIYQLGSSERERIIQRELENFTDNSLEKFEKTALEITFLSSLDKLESQEALSNWYQSLTKFYPPDKIPDTIYIRLMSIATQKKFQSVQKLLEG